MISISNNSVKQTLEKYLLQYRSVFKKRSFDIFYWLIMSILCMEEVRSVKFLYDYFLQKYTDKVLNSIYYFLSYSKFGVRALTAVTVSIALSLIPEKLKNLTIFITIDDTLQAKFGNKFDCYYKLFDHAKKTGNKYLNGHCFVAMVINIPLYHREEVKYLSLPVGYRLYSKDQSKLEIAADMIETIMPKLINFKVVLLCDSWYTKGKILDTVKNNDNLEILGAVRHDTVIYDLPPAPTGKRGRPKTKGDRLNYKDFSYEQIGEYHVATKMVLTNLFKKPVYVTITTTDKETFSSVRMYISSLNPSEISIFTDNQNPCKEKDDITQNKMLAIYRVRWNIEVIFYQHKFFWSFGNYMVRNKAAIERYANLLTVAYTFVCVLPFICPNFKRYQFSSPQVIKRAIGEHLSKELIFASFVSNFENTNIYSTVKKAVKSFIDSNLVA